MSEKISVIIPIYNVQRYLKESIESVLTQTYSDLQIILIDDGSTDQSGAICDEFARKDDRIIVVHQKNGGAANAKNTGLRLATGKYLAFLDSDDYLENDAYAFMINQIKKYQADIVQCCFRKIFTNKAEDRVTFKQETEMDATSYLSRFTKEWTCGLLWDKLYLRELFDGIFFEEGHKIDDEFFTYQGVMNAKKIVRVPKIIYNYRQRLSGVMLSESSQQKIVMDELEYLSIRRKNVVRKFPELKKDFDEHYLNKLLILSKNFYISEEEMLKIKELLKMYYQEKNRISIAFGLKRRLMHLQYSSVSKLLKEKVQSVEGEEINSYYE